LPPAAIARGEKKVADRQQRGSMNRHSLRAARATPPKDVDARTFTALHPDSSRKSAVRPISVVTVDLRRAPSVASAMAIA
jgi:hypothetical protein